MVERLATVWQQLLHSLPLRHGLFQVAGGFQKLREVFAHGVARHVVEGNPCAHIKAKAIIGAPPSRRTRIMLTDAELIAMLGLLPQIGRENELASKILLATCTRIGD